MTDTRGQGPGGPGKDTPPAHGAEEIRKAVEARLQEEAQFYPEAKGNVAGVTSVFIEQCMNANELGDGLLYAALQKDRYIWNASAAEWMLWKGHTWDRDLLEGALAAVEDVVDRLIEETGEIAKKIDWAVKKADKGVVKSLEQRRDAIYKRIARYRTERGRTAMLKFSRTCREPLAIRGDELDLNPWLLGCANGVLDLRTAKFRDGRPDEYISKASPVAWEGLDARSEAWEAWLREVFNGDEELIAFVQRAMGYAITGLSHEHIFLVLWGHGRNGKGTFVETISSVLGPLAGPIQAEMLLDQGRMKTSSGPSPDIMALRGLRVAFASETDEGRRFSPSRVKWLTGGDTLVGRYPHDKYEVSFSPTHTLILLTNHKPQAPATDFAFWERIYLVPFKFSFVDREPIAANERRVKKGLVDELKKDGARILAWMVRGCMEYQKLGLAPPKCVTEATAEYRRDEDDLADFLEDYCRLDDYAKVKATVLFENYSRWFEKNVSKKGITQTRFGRMMRQRFTKGKAEGVIYYYGLEITREVPEEDKK